MYSLYYLYIYKREENGEASTTTTTTAIDKGDRACCRSGGDSFQQYNASRFKSIIDRIKGYPTKWLFLLYSLEEMSMHAPFNLYIYISLVLCTIYILFSSANPTQAAFSFRVKKREKKFQWRTKLILFNVMKITLIRQSAYNTRLCLCFAASR